MLIKHCCFRIHQNVNTQSTVAPYPLPSPPLPSPPLPLSPPSPPPLPHTHYIGYTPTAVCLSYYPELKRFLPGRFTFKLKKLPQGLPWKTEHKDKIFELARSPSCFYQVALHLHVSPYNLTTFNMSRSSLKFSTTYHVCW